MTTPYWQAIGPVPEQPLELTPEMKITERARAWRDGLAQRRTADEAGGWQVSTKRYRTVNYEPEPCSVFGTKPICPEADIVCALMNRARQHKMRGVNGRLYSDFDADLDRDAADLLAALLQERFERNHEGRAAE